MLRTLGVVAIELPRRSGQNAIGALGVATTSIPVERQPRRNGGSSYARGRRIGYAAWALASAIRVRARSRASIRP